MQIFIGQDYSLFSGKSYYLINSQNEFSGKILFESLLTALIIVFLPWYLLLRGGNKFTQGFS